MKTWAGSPYFTEKELTCKCGCGGLPKDEFVKLLVTMRSEANFPFIVTSGYRCPEHNKNVSNSGIEGPHTLGLACDLKVYGNRAVSVIKLGLKHGVTGIGIAQKGPVESRFVHIDSVPFSEEYVRPNIWSY